MGRTKFRVVVLSAVLVAATASLVVAGGVSGDAAPAVGGAAPAAPTGPGGTWGDAQYLTGVPSNEGSAITSVSCTSPGYCGAAGYQDSIGSSSSTVQPVMVSEIAGAWGKAQEIPGLASLNTGGYSKAWGGISCASAGNCATGGFYQTKSRQTVAFVADETNGTWSPAESVTGIPSPGSITYSDVSSVSCDPAGNCTAVGSYVVNNSQGLAFMVSETGGTWGPAQVIPGLASLDGGTALNPNGLEVACGAVGDCAVTGTTSAGPFVVNETDGSWGNAEALPGLAAIGETGGTTPMALSCSSAGNCAAGGYFITATNADVGFVVDETDGTWGNAQAVPGLDALSTAHQAYVTSMSCPSAGNCGATGYYWLTNPVDVIPFVANETGGTWGPAQAIPGTYSTARPDGYAYAISCAAPGDCTAGGNYVSNGHGGVGFVANETGGTWGTAQPVVRQGSALDGVESLSCAAPGYCSGGGGDSPFGWVIGEGTATATELTVSTPNLTFGNEQAETLSATVTSPAGGTPTGTVTVFAGGGTACTMALTAGSGSCALSATSIPAGSDDLVAAYSGDTSYTASSSAPSTVTVAKAASATSLAVAKASVTYGQETTEQLTATVGADFGGVATGTVTFTAGTKTVCSVSLTAGKGSCALSATSLAAGNYHVTASYSGDASHAGSSSAAAAMTVTQATSKTSLGLAKATITYGQETAEHLTVTVAPQFGGTPTGKVTLKAGKTIICTVTLKAGKGTCTLTARQLKAGSYTLTAAYGGSTDYRPSTSPGRVVKVLK
jgi:hypothetical protein